MELYKENELELINEDEEQELYFGENNPEAEQFNEAIKNRVPKDLSLFDKVENEDYTESSQRSTVQFYVNASGVPMAITLEQIKQIISGAGGTLDGIKFRVEGEALEVSYDDGETWTAIGNVKGKDGYTPQKGTDYFDGKTPYINNDGYWCIGDNNTGVKAKGTDGVNGETPYIKDGYWWIGDENLNVKAQGEKGASVTITSKNESSVDGGYNTLIFSDGTSLTIRNGTKGQKGDGFSITKTYSSIAEMNAGYSSDGVPINSFVLIETGNVEDKDNAKLFIKGATKYEYLTDLSGSQGIQGERGMQGDPGVGISKIEKTNTNGKVDTYTIYYTNNTTSTFVVTNGQDGQGGNLTEADISNIVAQVNAQIPYAPAYTVEITAQTKVIDMINALQNLGADISQFNIVSFTGYAKGIYGLQIFHYGGNVYNIAGINLRTGETTSVTIDWSNKSIGDFQVTFMAHQLKQDDGLNTNSKEVVGAINEVNEAVGELDKKIPTNTSQLTNDSGFLTEHQSLTDYAKKSELPSKTSELTNDSGFIKASEAPVQSVNGKTGAVSLSATDVSARPNTWTPNYSDVGAEKSGAVNTHNTNTEAHNDIRIELKALADRINAVLDSDDTTLDELSEIVAYIKSNKALIDGVTTSKVNVSDIINNLTSNVTNKPLSAAQGVVLKVLIDAITVPTKVSELENDSKFLTSVPSEYVTETELNNKGYLTEHQNLAGYAKTADHYTKTESDSKYQAKGNYLTSIPSEYVTETELSGKGYAVKSSAETWTFKLKDGSTVTKKVVLA